MKLDKLRGWGPWLAFASPGLAVLAVLAFISILAAAHPAPSTRPPAAVIAAVGAATALLALAAICGLVVALDLEWIEHPLTHTGMTYVALAGATVGTLAFLALLVESFFVPAGWVAGVTGLLIPAGWGVYLVVINVVGLQARIFGRTLAWIGMLAGASWLATAVFGVVLLGAVGFTVIPGLLLYAIWSVWLAFRLRGRAPEPAALAA